MELSIFNAAATRKKLFAAILTALVVLFAYRARGRRLVNIRRRVLVTGGGAGMGLATAKYLAQRGDFVILVDVDAASATEAAKAIGEANAMALDFDVRHIDAARSAASRLQAQLGGECLDAILNFAGVLRGGPLVEMEPLQLQVR
jgi:NAD(P)-dependent dehydrogenase (short-subunit alcohol dehydrogenase family)